MRTYAVTHVGFHGTTRLAVRPQAIMHEDHVAVDGTMIGQVIGVVSARVARRLNRTVCDIEHCRCGGQIAYEDRPDQWLVVLD